MEPSARGRRVDDLPAPRDSRPRKLHGDVGREHPRPGFPRSIPADCGATMLIHGFVAHSRVNGPGMRAVIYVQGCNLGCTSCWNPATHAFVGPSRGVVQDVAEQVAAAHQTQFIDGVTFSGGEPMQQASDLLGLIRLLKRARPELSVGMYSGYTQHELDSGRFWTQYGIVQEARRRIWEDIKQ